MAAATGVRTSKERPEGALAAAVLQVTHLRGCPVALNPDDPAWQARVEIYPADRWRVTHCMECGALAYDQE
jgi:hypothetical protein